jgi:hypothetical protein
MSETKESHASKEKILMEWLIQVLLGWHLDILAEPFLGYILASYARDRGSYH